MLKFYRGSIHGSMKNAYEARNCCMTSIRNPKFSVESVCVCIYISKNVCIHMCVFVCVYIYATKIWNSTQLRSTGVFGHSALFLPGHLDISYTSMSVLLPCLAPEHTNSSALNYAVETG